VRRCIFYSVTGILPSSSSSSSAALAIYVGTIGGIAILILAISFFITLRLVACIK